MATVAKKVMKMAFFVYIGVFLRANMSFLYEIKEGKIFSSNICILTIFIKNRI